MPPKRIVKSGQSKSKPPPVLQKRNDEDGNDTAEAELKFDQEVLWCISQFEKLLNSEKLTDSKKLETTKAMNKLRNPNLAKIQKLQLMRQFFKDYKSKMKKDEEAVKNQAQMNFDINKESDKLNKGVFLKKKSSCVSDETSKTFLFNFKNPSEDDLNQVTAKINSVGLS